MPRLRGFRLALVGPPLLAVLLAASPAIADARATVPPDVASAFAGAAEWMQVAFDSDPVLEKATGVREIVEVFEFTDAYIHDETGTAVQPSGIWVATIVDAGGNSIGVLQVWRPDGGSAEIAGGSANVGGDLASVGTGVYIEEPMTGSAFVLRGGILFPFNDAANGLMPRPTTLTAFQSVMAQWVADSDAAANNLDPDYNLWFLGGALVLSTAVGLMVIFQRRRLDRKDRIR